MDSFFIYCMYVGVAIYILSFSVWVFTKGLSK